jgi:hypothetical protein
VLERLVVLVGRALSGACVTILIRMTLRANRGVLRNRRSPRYPVENVQGSLHFNTEARVLNLSLTGIALETHLAVRVGRTYSITLRKDLEQAVCLSANVMWCHLREIRKTRSGESKPVYAAGLQFTDTLTDKAGLLVRFLEGSAVVTVGQRVTGRFRLEFDHVATVEAAYEFVVKNVSLHGLLVETGLSPEVGEIFDIEVFMPAFTLRTRARVAFSETSQLADRMAVTEVGMEYAELSVGDQTSLGAFIASELQAPQQAPS